MGIQRYARLMVGLPFTDLCEVHSPADILDHLEEGMSSGSYEYDSDVEDNIIGHIVCETSSYTDIDESIMSDVFHYKNEFRIKYGMEPKVFITMYVI